MRIAAALCCFCTISSFSSFAIAVSSGWAGDGAARGDTGWGHLSGRIVVEGQVPEPQPLSVTRDQAFCLQDGHQVISEDIVVSRDGGLRDAFVMMHFARTDRRRPAVHPSYEELLARPVTIDNAQCRFEPHALFLRTGQTLVMKNSDPIGHNCHVVTLRNERNVNLPPSSQVEVKFDESDRLPGDVKCDIHPWMRAVILIRDEPYVAITDENGQFKIENLPVGEWSFQFWHKQVGYMRDLRRDGQEVVGRQGELNVEIRDGETTDLGTLVIRASDLVSE